MKLIEFKEQNIVIAKNQPEYLPFPAYSFSDDEGTIVGCWSLSLLERMHVLIFGKIWHSILTFKYPLQPQLLSTIKPDMNRK